MLIPSCPACGEVNFLTLKQVNTISLPYAGALDLDLAYNRCFKCGTDGDFFGANDTIITNGYAGLRKTGVKNILTKLKEIGACEHYICRMFGISTNTLKEWEDYCTSENYILLCLVMKYPILLSVIEGGFTDLNSKLLLN